MSNLHPYAAPVVAGISFPVADAAWTAPGPVAPASGTRPNRLFSRARSALLSARQAVADTDVADLIEGATLLAVMGAGTALTFAALGL